jgi:hypothetical protein
VRVREPNVLIPKEAIFDMRFIIFCIDGLAAFPIHGRTSVSALNTEILDNPMNPFVLVVMGRTFFPCAKHPKVLTSLRTFLVKKFKHNSATGLFLLFFIVESDLEVKKALHILWVEVWKRFVHFAVLLLFYF